MRGPVWDRLLGEYYQERVLVDISVARVAAWPDLSVSGELEVTGAAWPGWPVPQQPPENGTGPRVDVAKATERVAMLPHRVLAYRGADGFPVIAPVHVAGYDARGLRLVAPPGLLPPGGRRAGLLAHAYRAHLVGLTSRVFTGWLEAGDNGAVYAPHTSKGFVAPDEEDAAGVQRPAGEVWTVAGPAPGDGRATGPASPQTALHQGQFGGDSTAGIASRASTASASPTGQLSNFRSTGQQPVQTDGAGEPNGQARVKPPG
jgi:hypothetical protein